MSLNIIHTADWHIGQTFYEYDREEEHRAFLKWLVEKLREEDADALLIAGDVFDVSNPSSVAQRMYYEFIREANHVSPKTKIIVAAGNHDSAARLEAANPVTEALNVVTVGSISRNADRTIDIAPLLVPIYNKEGVKEATCIAMPYLRQGDYPPADGEDDYTQGIARMYAAATEKALSEAKDGEAVIAMGHLYATGAELSENDRAERVLRGGLESLSADAFDHRLAYVALGHIHKAQRVGGRDNVRYAGSPLPMSFAEKNYNHQVVKIKIENGVVTEMEQIKVPIHTAVVSIPKEPLPVDEVLNEIEAIADRTEDDDRTRYPYAEVRVLTDGPDPSMRSRIEEAMEGKAVRLACITTVPVRKSKENEERKMRYEDFRQIEPLEMVRRIYDKRYDSELPEELAKLFNQVVREVQG
jgi:exonuclease SbcD